MSILAGRYWLEKRLGGGGMSVVWRAYDEVLGRQVAVKMVSPRHVNEALARGRIGTEARAARLVDHGHVAKILDYSDSAECPYLVMELLTGQTLAQRLRADRLPVRAALEICAQVADALAAAHAAGVVHRDIKPGNVMLTSAGATVLDFGIAAFLDESDKSGRPAESGLAGWSGSVPEDRIWGTAAYLAPERLTQRRALPASDVYALGVLLYRALTGRRPWVAVGRAEMLAAHVAAAPAPLPPDAEVPPEVAALCNRCLAKEPRRRPTAREVSNVLAAAAASTADLAPPIEAATTAAGAIPAMADPAKVVGRRRIPWRHAATGSGERRRRRLAVGAGSVGLLATMAVVLSFCAVSNESGGQGVPQAAPPRPPSTAGPYDSPPGSTPPSAGPAAPAESAPAGSGTGGSSSQAGRPAGSDTVPASGSDTGGRGNGYGRGTGGGKPPSPKPTPRGPKRKSNARPTPTPAPTTSSQPPGVAGAADVYRAGTIAKHPH